MKWLDKLIEKHPVLALLLVASSVTLFIFVVMFLLAWFGEFAK